MMDYTQSVNNVEYVTLICQAINQVYTLIKAGIINKCLKNLGIFQTICSVYGFCHKIVLRGQVISPQPNPRPGGLF